MELAEAFRLHQREIYLYLAKVTGDSRLAEDLTQDTFLRAFRAALTFRGEATMRTWLFAIARNVLVSHHRRHRVAESEVGESLCQEAAVGRDPTTALSVHQTLARLPINAREALVLCDLLGFDPTEAAPFVGVSANVFRVRLHRARSLFREMHHGE